MVGYSSRDMTHDSIFEWARREFQEEVNYHDDFTIEPLGILNDDSNPVGHVHIGFVFLLKGTTGNISVNEELKSGHLASLDECKSYGDALETWSKMVVTFLEKRKRVKNIAFVCPSCICSLCT